MRILGIDPGIAITGYGLIEGGDGKNKFILSGYVKTSAREDVSQRLKKIYNQLEAVIRKTQPDIIAIERVFFARNIKSALIIGEVRGVIILAAGEMRVSVEEYTPLEVKYSITNNGRAPKEQIQKMVQKLLNLPRIPKPTHIADALAIALCHLHRAKFTDILKKRG
jgi:crossover junction endodeoxyribonuclease RuvC